MTWQRPTPVRKPRVVDEKAELAQLFEALESQALRIGLLAGSAGRSLRANSYRDYLEFRRGIDEFRSLVVLLEERLAHLNDDRVAGLREQFERIDLLVLTSQIAMIRDFSLIVADCRELPLGAYELFAPDLESLNEAELRLSRPEYAGRVDPAIVTGLHDAADTLKQLLDRLTPLPDFSEPSDADADTSTEPRDPPEDSWLPADPRGFG